MFLKAAYSSNPSYIDRYVYEYKQRDFATLPRPRPIRLRKKSISSSLILHSKSVAESHTDISDGLKHILNHNIMRCV